MYLSLFHSMFMLSSVRCRDHRNHCSRLPFLWYSAWEWG